MRRNILERFREEHGDKRIALLHKKAPPHRIGARRFVVSSITVCRSIC
jgi:hypothetical protein